MGNSIRLTLAAALGAVTLASTAYADNPADSYHDDDSRACASGSASDHGRQRALRVVGLTADQRLICFSERAPRRADDIGHVAGLSGDAQLVGIDFRVQDGMLYGVGNAGGLYRLDTGSAMATRIGQLSVALAGASFGVDFNPAANALRIVSNTGQNLRVPFGLLDTQGNLNGVMTATDGALNNGATPPVGVNGISGAAYTNNDLAPATATTLFDLNTTTDQVVVQSPANSGIVVASGALGVDAQLDTGFDIYSTVRDGVTVDVQGFAALNVMGAAGGTGASAFYKVDVLTGKATLRGNFAERNRVIGIAIPLNQN